MKTKLKYDDDVYSNAVKKLAQQLVAATADDARDAIKEFPEDALTVKEYYDDMIEDYLADAVIEVRRKIASYSIDDVGEEK
jgi:hypothetical protein